MSLGRVYDREYIKKKSRVQWLWAFHDILIASNTKTLAEYQDRLHAPYVDANYMPKTAMKWWLRARVGQAIGYQYIGSICPCDPQNPKAQYLATLQHMAQECSHTQGARRQWWNKFGSLARVMGWTKKTTISTMLSIHHAPKIRMIVGELCRMVIQEWRRYWEEDPNRTPPNERTPEERKARRKLSKPNPLNRWCPKERVGTSLNNRERDYTETVEENPTVLYQQLGKPLPVLPRDCGRTFIRIVPGVEGRFKDRGGNWEEKLMEMEKEPGSGGTHHLPITMGMDVLEEIPIPEIGKNWEQAFQKWVRIHGEKGPGRKLEFMDRRRRPFHEYDV
jgi:hypothetical protein